MIYRSPFPPLDAGFAAVPQLVRDIGQRMPDQPAIVTAAGDPAISYGRLAGQIDRMAADLADRGFSPGDVLAIRAPNMPAWAVAALAAAVDGGPQLLPPAWRVEEELTCRVQVSVPGAASPRDTCARRGLAPEPADGGQEHSCCHSGTQQQEKRGPLPASDTDRWPSLLRRCHRMTARLTGWACRGERHGNHAGGQVRADAGGGCGGGPSDRRGHSGRTTSLWIMLLPSRSLMM